MLYHRSKCQRSCCCCSLKHKVFYISRFFLSFFLLLFQIPIWRLFSFIISFIISFIFSFFLYFLRDFISFIISLIFSFFLYFLRVFTSFPSSFCWFCHSCTHWSLLCWRFWETFLSLLMTNFVHLFFFISPFVILRLCFLFLDTIVSQLPKIVTGMSKVFENMDEEKMLYSHVLVKVIELNWKYAVESSPP